MGGTAMTAGVDATRDLARRQLHEVPPLLQLPPQGRPESPPPGSGTCRWRLHRRLTARPSGHRCRRRQFICGDRAKKLGGRRWACSRSPQDREPQKYLKGAQSRSRPASCTLVQVIQTKGLTVGEAVQETKDLLLTAHPEH